MSLFNLTGLQAIVSGGSGWLGSAMTRAFLRHGASVTIVGRDAARIEQIFADEPGDWRAVAADIRSEEWPAAVAAVAKEAGRIDILLNNAHVGRGGSLAHATRDNFTEAFDLAVLACAESANAAMPGFRSAVAAGGSPCIINVASMYGQVAPDPSMYQSSSQQNPPYYGAAKAAMIQLTRYMAAEFGPEGIRANAITPGPFPAGGAQSDQGFIERLSQRTMLGRIGSPEEIASTAIYLASPASSFVTGAVIPVDGGWTAW